MPNDRSFVGLCSQLYNKACDDKRDVDLRSVMAKPFKTFAKRIVRKLS